MATMNALSANFTKTLTSPLLSPPSSRATSVKSIPSSLFPNPMIPSSSRRIQNKQPYQPFRPPPSPLPPQFSSLDTAARLDILANRLGLWFEYAPLIPSLLQEGYTPSTIEEATGITSVDQNCLVVAAQVRDSLIQSGTDPEIISYFDGSGSQILYEIRLLSSTQRSAAAALMVQKKFDGNEAQELARAMKDFPRRKGDPGWERFDYTLPGDCLAFMYYRHSKEHRIPSEQQMALEKAMAVAVTEEAKAAVMEEMHG